MRWKMAGVWVLLPLLLICTPSGVSSSHFRGAIIMVQPQPGGSQYQMEISYRISWRRSYRTSQFGSRSHFCDSRTINGLLIRGQGDLECQYGCSGTFSAMSYVCTSFSIQEDWTYGERVYPYDFSFVAGQRVTIGFTGNDWIDPIGGGWNVSTGFSLAVRNDTGRINSTPRAVTAPIIRLVEGCNHTIPLAVNDPDGDTVRCRWAQGRECAGLCGQFQGAHLDTNTCVITYQSVYGTRYWGAAVMLEDFALGTSTPLSSVALQFLVLVIPNTNNDSCSQLPTFVEPTILAGSCVAVPPQRTFTTQLVAATASAGVAIIEIQTFPPLGTRVGGLTQNSTSNTYYVNVTWTPELSQQNQTHMLCSIAVGSDTQSSSQVCFDLLPGLYPPAPIAATAQPNQQRVRPTNATWRVRFDTNIERSSVQANITFHVYSTEEPVYSIDASQSPEVDFSNGTEFSITPNFQFPEKTQFYILFGRQVVQGLEYCGPGNEPVLDKNFWTFVTLDVTPPTINVLASNNTTVGANASFSWESNENVTWRCVLENSSTQDVENVTCSEASWRGYGLSNGSHVLVLTATDEAGNVATTRFFFVVDLTPPNVAILNKPSLISNEQTPTLTFSCDDELPCQYECLFLSEMTQQGPSPCNTGQYATPPLQPNASYTFQVRATDQVGNRGESASYSWEIDFQAPSISGIRNISVSCNETGPAITGQPQAVDNRPGNISVVYSDFDSGCSIVRTWTARDMAGNTARLVQEISLEFSPTVSLLPLLSLPCDSADTGFQVSTNTVHVPNTCELPLQLLHEDSEYTCPGTIVRNWTATICGESAAGSQTITLYDICPSHACGRNESVPRGSCSLGECQCNRPWYGENCDTIIYEPVAEPINNTILLEGEYYVTTADVSRGSPPLLWTLVSGPEGLFLDQYNGQVTWSSVQVGHHMVVVKIENQVGRTESVWNIVVAASYNVTLLPFSSLTFSYPQPIALRGYVEFIGNASSRRNQTETMSNVLVSIDIFTSSSSARTLRTRTFGNNSFSVTFVPPATEYGTYTAGARHPSFSQSLPQVQWKILGMRNVPLEVMLNGETVGAFGRIFYNATVIHNDGPGTLTGLTATPVLPSTRDVSIEISLRGYSSNSAFLQGEQIAMDINVTVSRPLSGRFLIIIRAREGTTLRVIANLRIERTLPSLLIDPPVLNSRIVRGRSRVYEFNVTNIGRAAATNVQSFLPNTAFISLIGFGNMQQSEGSLTLQSGESGLYSILTQTPATQQLGSITATIIISSSETYTSLPIDLTVSSDSLMNFTVIVEDEYTYFASGRPLVDDAMVTIINHQRRLRLVQSTSTTNGTAEFPNIYEDRYEMFVEAPSHRTYRQILLTSIESPVLTVFIERQAVTYTWHVTPITFQDTYLITLEADFETRVPIPVVTVTPNEINLDDLEDGLVISFQLNITNHGLIRADDVNIRLPSHPLLDFSTTSQSLGDLEALSSVVIVVNSSRRSVQKRNADGDVCTDYASYRINIIYGYICNEAQTRNTPVVVKSPVIYRCQLGDPVRRPNSGGGGGNGDGELGRGGVIHFTPADFGDPDIRLDGDPTDSPNPGSFSFNGYSADTPVSCIPCVSSIVGCVAPSPLELATKDIPLPLAGCIPVILSGTNPLSTVSGTLDLLQCSLGNKFTGFALCAYQQDLFSKCLRSTSSKRRRRNIRRALNEVLEGLYPIQQSIALGVEVLGDEVWLSVGDPQWLSDVLRPALDDGSEAGVLISAAELSSILSAPAPNNVTTKIVTTMVERLNNTYFGWTSGQLEPSQGFNMASFSAVRRLAQNIDTYNDLATGKGFSSYVDAYNFASAQVNQIEDLQEEAGVCAVVRVRIEQELALTREAFQASLGIENMENSPLDQLYAEIIITDLTTGEEATHLFSIGNGTLSGSLSSSVDGWSLGSGAMGAVEWLIIPYSEAAIDSDHMYNVGGSFGYIVDGENISVPLVPAPIIVRPDPSLRVHYFWERQIVGDNPFTEEVEPSVPFTLGVAVKNAGYGTASSLQITSAQPEIIDNERGLLIDFMIIGANIGSETASPSITVSFGDLLPNTTIVARWYMIASLQGEFMSYSADFENMNPLGDPKLSVLDDLQIHELIRNVEIYISGESDDILDFLVNDRDDRLAYPDTLYSSRTLERYNVSVGSVLSVQRSPGVSLTLVARTSANSTGWVYYRHQDMQGILSNSAVSVNISKREGNLTVALPSHNSWITRVRNERLDTESFYLHILDYVMITEEVVFMLEPCMTGCPSVDLPFTQPTSKLPTPSVRVPTPLSENLYAGTPLTLTCMVDTDPSLSGSVNISVMWLRNATPVSNATISSLVGSQFSSNLTFHFLRIEDSASFTCRACIVPAEGLTSATASDMGEDSVEIIVEVPEPTVSIATSSDSAIAGDPFVLTCLVTNLPNNLISDPVLSWSGAGVDQSSVQLLSEGLNLSLSFSPLQTSQGGVYTCTTTLSIPEAGISITETSMTTITVLIPAPILSISESPINLDFFQGLDVTFTCNIVLNSAVNSPITILARWNRNGTDLGTNVNKRISVTNASIAASTSTYNTTLRFNPLDLQDVGTYTCEVTVLAEDAAFIFGITAYSMRNIRHIYSFPVQNVSIIEEGLSTAGHPGYMLLCTVLREQLLTSSTTLSLQWLDSEGLEIVSGGENFVIEEGSPSGFALTSTLAFTSLITSLAGEYVCRASMTIPCTEILNHTVDSLYTVTVKLPAPEVTLIVDRSDGAIYEGTAFSIYCMVMPNTTGVDTDFEVQRSFSELETELTDRVSLLDTVRSTGDIQIALTFSPLVMNDTGTYECTATVNSTHPHVTASDSTSNNTTVFVDELPPPNVTIQSVTGGFEFTAGTAQTLVCSAAVVDHLTAEPVVDWIWIESANSTLMNGSVLTIDPLKTSHAGAYTCEATLSIPRADINNLTSTVTKNITVRIPTPVLSVAEHLGLAPYNGTNFTLSGLAQLDGNVDISITATSIWSGSGAPQVSNTPPYLTSMEFRPLATNSSGEYVLNVTFTPTNSSPFIATSSASLVYNLMVQPLPSLSPTIRVVSRQLSSDSGCGEARTINCTFSTVQNLFKQPEFTWVGPTGSEVPTGSGSNPEISSQTGELVFSDITNTSSSQYTCRVVVNITEAQIFNYFEEAAIIVSSNTPGPVRNLRCNKSSLPSELSFSWEVPGALEEVNGYQVELKELQYRAGANYIVPLTDFSTTTEWAYFNQGLTGMVPYEVAVRAVSSAGCGKQEYVYCFTQEGVPPPPKNVMVSRVNSTAIDVSWDSQTLLELKGLADYVVTYYQVSSKKRQAGNTVTVPWTENNVVISNLTQGVDYNVSVSTSTSVGTSALVISTTPPEVAETENHKGAVVGLALALGIVLTIAVVAAVIVIAVYWRRHHGDVLSLKQKRFDATEKVPSRAPYKNPLYEDEVEYPIPEEDKERSYL